MDTVTIKDIAKMCGVGVSTVSRAINNHPDINQTTKDMIMNVIKDHNYVPNNSARNLKRQDAKCIAVLVKGISNPFFSSMIDIIERETHKRKYSFILQRVEELANELDVAIELVKEKKLRGIIFLGGNFSHNIEKLKLLTVPFVLSTTGMVDDLEKKEGSFVSVDDFKESYKIVDYLCKLGHKDIAIFAASEEDQSIGQLRFAGYEKALMDHGIEVNQDLVYRMNYDTDSYSLKTGYKLGRKFVQEGKSCTAIYAIADSLAIGVCRAIQESGFKIPEDYSIAGFDGIELGGYLTPSLTTLRQPVEDMALATIQILFDVIEESKSHRQIFFDGELLERESTQKLED